MEREYPLLLIFVFLLVAGLACIFGARLLGRRVTEETLTATLARGRLGAHAMAMFVAVQGWRALAGADPRALSQAVGAGVAVGDLRASLGFALDGLAAPHLVVIAVVATLDGIVIASLAGRHRLVEAGRRSLVFALAAAAVMADSLVGLALAWLALAPIVAVDARRRRERMRSEGGEEGGRAIGLEGVGVAAAMAAILLAQATVASQRWDALARAAFAELRTPLASGILPAHALLSVFGVWVATRVLGVARRRFGVSGFVMATTLGITCAYLLHRCVWILGWPTHERVHVLVAVASLVALALAWALVRDEPSGVPGGRRLARWQRGSTVAARRVLERLRLPWTAATQAARGVDLAVRELVPNTAVELLHQLGRSGAGLGRRAGVDVPGARRTTAAFLCGVVVVLASLYFKPSVVTPLPDEIHGFGGVRARMHREERRPPARAGDSEGVP